MTHAFLAPCSVAPPRGGARFLSAVSPARWETCPTGAPAARFQWATFPARWETCPTGARRGYTLFELVVVVTIVVLIGALTLPSLVGVLADARLDASGDMIRARMADARSMAMSQGRTIRFGFLPGSGKWQIAADDSPLWDSVDTSGPAEDDDQMHGELLQDVIFGKDTTAFTATGSPEPSGAWQVGGIFISDGTGHAAVNPDGTTVDDVTFYFGKAGFSPMAVQFRGLTGAVRVFDPTVEEQQP